MGIESSTYGEMSGKLTSDQVLQIANDRIERQTKAKAQQDAAAQKDCQTAPNILNGLEFGVIPTPPPGPQSRSKSIIPDPDTLPLPDKVIQAPMKGSLPGEFGQPLPRGSITLEQPVTINEVTAPNLAVAPNSSDKRSEDPEKVRVFQEFIANIGANEPKITTITSLGEILKVMVKMIKNPEHLAQLNAAINTRFGKSITIVPGSVQDPGFAFLAFRGEENGKVQEYSLWMDSKNKLVKKNWFSPDEYKTVGTYSLGEHPLSPIGLQK